MNVKGIFGVLGAGLAVIGGVASIFDGGKKLTSMLKKDNDNDNDDFDPSEETEVPEDYDESFETDSSETEES